MGVVYPLILSVLFFSITIILVVFKKFKRPQFLEWAILFPVTTALFFWFFTAPDPRFVNALFFLLADCMMLLFLIAINQIGNKRIFGVVLCITLLIGNLQYLIFTIQNIGLITEISYTGYQPIQIVPLDEKVTKSGLTIFTPETGDQCWDSPLPCTPYLNRSLMLREPGNLTSGFKIK